MALTPVQVGMPLDEFIRLYDTEGPFELVNGERIPKIPNVAGHGLCAEMLRHSIHAYVAHNKLGQVMVNQVFVLSYTSNWVAGSRIPDVMYYTADRLEGYKATAQVYTLLASHPLTKQVVTLKSGDTLQGGEIIPGFEIAVVQLFT
jgi:Uma2 family endonuclease